MIRISQSLMTAWAEYTKAREGWPGGLCGWRFKAVWIDGHREPPSVYMRIGQYFEYMATGALNYYGEVPEPVRLKNPKKLTRALCKKIMKAAAWKPDYEPAEMIHGRIWFRTFAELATDFLRAEEQAKNFKRLAAEMGITWNEGDAGGKVYKDDLSASIDLMPSYEGRKVVIDLKAPKDLQQTFGPFSWGQNRDGEWMFANDPKRVRQARHYHLITGKPFYFWVFEISDRMANRLIEVTFSESGLDSHRREIDQVREGLANALDYGFSPLPSYERCDGCPIAEQCEKRMVLPEIISVEV